MRRLSIRLTKDNDEELGRIASYLAGNGQPSTAQRIYDDIEEMKNLMTDGMCHFTFTKVNG